LPPSVTEPVVLRILTLREKLEGDRHRPPRLRRVNDEMLGRVNAEKAREIAERFDAIHTVQRAREVGSLDEVIAPSALRPALIEAVEEGLSECEMGAHLGTDAPLDPDRRSCLPYSPSCSAWTMNDSPFRGDIIRKVAKTWGFGSWASAPGPRPDSRPATRQGPTRGPGSEARIPWQPSLVRVLRRMRWARDGTEKAFPGAVDSPPWSSSTGEAVFQTHRRRLRAIPSIEAKSRRRWPRAWRRGLETAAIGAKFRLRWPNIRRGGLEAACRPLAMDGASGSFTSLEVCADSNDLGYASTERLPDAP
jgi:hypothetical protein